LAQRRVWIGLVALLACVVPAAASFAAAAPDFGVVALIVAFGLSLNAAVHYLNRLRLEDRPGEDPAIGVERATVLIGPALVLTSPILAFGLGVTVLSDLPSLRLFGKLSAMTLVAALIGDLVLLPASVLLYRRFMRRLRPAPHAKHPHPHAHG
jgi:predicted RND superfamily exporter protein